MTYRRYHRNRTVEDCPCHFFFIEGPQIFDRAATSSNDDHIYFFHLQHTDSPHNGLFGAFSLHLSRIKNQLYIRIASRRYIHDIPDCRSCRCSHYADSLRISRNCFLIFRCKHSHLFEFFLRNKRKEWEEYRTRVSSWEREKYIINY